MGKGRVTITGHHVRLEVAKELAKRLKQYGSWPALAGLSDAESARAAIEGLIEQGHGAWDPNEGERKALSAVLGRWAPPPRPPCLEKLRVWLLPRAPDFEEVHIVFDVHGDLSPLVEPKATVLGEELRLAAAGHRGEYGIEGARAVADKIEDVLVGRSETVVIAGDDEEEALFYALNVSTINSDTTSEERVLYDVVQPLHESRLRDEDESSSP